MKTNRRPIITIFFLATLIISLLFGQVVSAQVPNSSDLVEQGVKDYGAGNFSNAIKRWQQALPQYKNNPSVTAVISENLARAYQQLRQDKEAIESLSAAISNYNAVNNIQQVGRMKSELAQVYSNLGQPRKAIVLLCGEPINKSQSSKSQKTESGSKKNECTPESAKQIATKYNDKNGLVAALGILGEAYRLIGNYDQAIIYLNEAQQVTSEDKFLVLNSLGNAYKNRAQLQDLQSDSAKQAGLSEKEKELTEKSVTDYKKAREYFRDSIELARQQKQASAEIRGLLNLIKLSSQASKVQVIDNQAFTKTYTDALKVLETLPDSATKVYGAIDLAYLQRNDKNDKRISPFTHCPLDLVFSDDQASRLLNQALLSSEKLRDNRLQSYSDGALGHFWECRNNYKLALKYTQRAIIAADKNQSAKDSLYLWEWQAGRILDKQKKEKQAIEAYQRAFDILEKLRSDILTAERDVQFDFRDVVDPLYRTLAQSRLELLSKGAVINQQREEELSKVVDTIDALKLAELQNYFGNDCILSALSPKNVSELLKENSTIFNDIAFLSSIILDSKIGILLQLPNQITKFKWIEDPLQQDTTKIVESGKFKKTIEKFRKSLTRGKEETEYDNTYAAQLYDWIIRPILPDINPDKIKTLVFIQDGFLRSIPMAALFDKKDNQYLVQKYAIATTPSLRFRTPKRSTRDTQRALILGLTQEAKIDGKTFPRLSSVNSEVQAIRNLFSNSLDLLDDKFILKNFEDSLQKITYSIIHVASHARFGIIPEDSFIVAGKNDKITISQLESSLRNLNSKSNSVELLALTACNTAVGDDRVILGLAGVALQVGVKSTIASLWKVDDKSISILVKDFYTNYRNEGMSIAQALQKAQLKMIENKKNEYNNPAYWAAMIIIGNWL
ncbi:MAG: CHAT domain-containing protein [Scytonematopsis contorta HA4267-MV1]|jgi:CHAT domain-containing protein/lipopolysaccharide biosynthesis regulator YciM|nr:CHAT domain-containing protein [Scytonematopsis contorta HA4267-MV1]